MLCISPKNYRKKDKILGHPNRYPNLTIIQFPYGDSSPTDYVGGGSLAMVAIDGRSSSVLSIPSLERPWENASPFFVLEKNRLTPPAFRYGECQFFSLTSSDKMRK